MSTPQGRPTTAVSVWLTSAVGVLLTIVGLLLIVRPLSALSLLGTYIAICCLAVAYAEITSYSRHRLWSILAAAIWFVVGVTGLAWWGTRIDWFVPVVAGLLIVSGALSLVRAVPEGVSWPGFALVATGLADVLFGLLAITWPDLTLVVVGALFGGRTAVFGLTLLIRSLHHSGADQPDRTHRMAGGMRYLAAAAALVVAVGATWVSHDLRDGVPVTDAFYDTPADLPDAPGELIRTSPYRGQLPEGTKATRIYYTTTNADGDVIASSGVLLLPADAKGEVPLISWAHGTVGVARHCAPSLHDDVFASGAEPAIDRIAELGWAMVATDYPGMGAEGDYPYLIGEGQGRAVLDAARAARQVKGTSFTDATVIWGHSQGGHAALWAGQLAESYAPDLNVVGTAALSPAANTTALADMVFTHQGSPGASLLLSYVATSYAGYYDDIDLDDITSPGATTLLREASARCVNGDGTLVTVLTGIAVGKDRNLVDESALTGTLGRRLEENIPTGPWSAPVFVGQGEADEVIPFHTNKEWVADRCAEGVDLQFTGYPGGSHMSILEPGTDLETDVVAWTQDRFDGTPVNPGCQ